MECRRNNDIWIRNRRPRRCHTLLPLLPLLLYHYQPWSIFCSSCKYSPVNRNEEGRLPVYPLSFIVCCKPSDSADLAFGENSENSFVCSYKYSKCVRVQKTPNEKLSQFLKNLSQSTVKQQDKSATTLSVFSCLATSATILLVSSCIFLFVYSSCMMT